MAGQVADIQTERARARLDVITRSHFTRIADAREVDAATLLASVSALRRASRSGDRAGTRRCVNISVAPQTTLTQLSARFGEHFGQCCAARFGPPRSAPRAQRMAVNSGSSPESCS